MNQREENKVIIDGITYHGGLNQPRYFVKMNVDCWEKILDFLSFHDILSMSQTCQRMRQIGGYYFRENFHGTVCNLHKFLSPRFRSNDALIALENCELLRFIDTVCIHGQMEHLEYYSDLLRSITTLQLCFVSFNGNEDFLGLETTFNGIESVEFDQCYIYGDSASKLLSLCPKLKRLRLDGVDFESSVTECNTIFQQTYAGLEYFQYTDCEKMPFLMSFLEQNRSVKYLRIGATDLWENQHDNTLTLSLDCLSVTINLMDIEPIEFAKRLKTLYAKEFYKKLHLSIDSSDDDLNVDKFFNEIRSITALEVLYTCPFHISVGHLTELKELYLHGLSDDMDLKTLALNLTKLERLWINGSIECLVPFLCYSNSLQIVIIFVGDSECSKNALNLFSLNQMRHTNGMQRKVLIGLFEQIYLATKWKPNNSRCDLIEFTRAESLLKYFEYKDMLF